MKRILLAAVAALCLTASAGGAEMLQGPAYQYLFPNAGMPCYGNSGYSSVAGGAAGTVLLGAGVNVCPSFATYTAVFAANWPTGTTVSNSTVYLYAPWAGTITSVDYRVGTGSYTLAVQIGGVNVTSCNALTVNSATKTNTVCTAANTFAAGALITIVITGVASSPSDSYVGVNMTRTS